MHPYLLPGSRPLEFYLALWSARGTPLLDPESSGNCAGPDFSQDRPGAWIMGNPHPPTGPVLVTGSAAVRAAASVGVHFQPYYPDPDVNTHGVRAFIAALASAFPDVGVELQRPKVWCTSAHRYRRMNMVRVPTILHIRAYLQSRKVQPEHVVPSKLASAS